MMLNPFKDGIEAFQKNVRRGSIWTCLQSVYTSEINPMPVGNVVLPEDLYRSLADKKKLPLSAFRVCNREDDFAGRMFWHSVHRWQPDTVKNMLGLEMNFYTKLLHGGNFKFSAMGDFYEQYRTLSSRLEDGYHWASWPLIVRVGAGHLARGGGSGVLQIGPGLEDYYNLLKHHGAPVRKAKRGSHRPGIMRYAIDDTWFDCRGTGYFEADTTVAEKLIESPLKVSWLPKLGTFPLPVPPVFDIEDRRTDADIGPMAVAFADGDRSAIAAINQWESKYGQLGVPLKVYCRSSNHALHAINRNIVVVENLMDKIRLPKSVAGWYIHEDDMVNASAIECADIHGGLVFMPPGSNPPIYFAKQVSLRSSVEDYLFDVGRGKAPVDYIDHNMYTEWLKKFVLLTYILANDGYDV